MILGSAHHRNNLEVISQDSGWRLGLGTAGMKTRTLAALLMMACTLCACSSGTNAITQTLQDVVHRTNGVADARLNPDFRYLRMVVNGRVVFLALGNEDSDPRGPIEVWFSAEREVLRFQNGRLVGAVGLTTEWRSVALPELPSWSAVAHAAQPLRWTRVRDVMPGYRSGVSDALVLRVTSPPKKSELQGVDPQSLTWFEEQIDPEPSVGYLAALGGSAAAENVLPPARYAVDFHDAKETVIYGEQCLQPKLCFTWQRWKP